MMYLRIGKQILVQALGTQNNYKLHNEDGSVSYYNEKNYYHIHTTERLSKLQIKQLLLYHFYNPDERGFVKHLDEKEIAKKLNCHVVTVRANNERLSELNYIWLCNSGKGFFSVVLPDYSKYHLTKEKGGYGYITLLEHTLEYLLTIDNINHLRLELRRLLQLNNSNSNNEFTYTYKEIQRILPDYFNHKSIIDKLLDTIPDEIFVTKRNDSYIAYKINDCHDYQYIKEKESKMLQVHFKSLFINKGYSSLLLTDKELDDYVQMAFQYGKDSVSNAILEVIDNYYENYRSVKNPGGLIRKIIKSNIATNLKMTI